MKATELKSDILRKIDDMSIRQLKEFYGLFQNYFNSNDTIEEWDTLTAVQRAKIEKGLEQADNNMTKPLEEVTSRLRKKYGLNG